MNLADVRPPCEANPTPFDDAFHIDMRPERLSPRAQQVVDECKAICEGCPVRDACLTMALDAEAGEGAIVRYGIFGGKTPRERLALNGNRTRPATRANHGTDARYHADKRAGIAPCELCIAAHSAANGENSEQRSARARAKSEAAAAVTGRRLTGRRAS